MVTVKDGWPLELDRLVAPNESLHIRLHATRAP